MNFFFRLSWSVPLCSLALIAGCNLFNPTGTYNVDESDADALISYAQKLYRSSAYADAADYYAKAIAVDSTKSEAYFGLAKAGMRNAGANPMEILQYVGATDDNTLPFMNESATIQNTYYRSMIAVDTALEPLINRDTLTELWEYAIQIDSLSSTADTMSDSLLQSIANFRTQYQSGASYVYTATGESFPVSDRKYKYDRFRVDYALASFIVTLMSFLDFNGDGYITSDDIPITISVDSNGNVSVDVSAVIDAALTDTAITQTLNDNIEKLADGSEDISALVTSLAGTLGLSDSATSSVLGEETQATLDSQITALGDAARFYKLGDHIDNDGDGCADEEIFDSLDNDYDGLVDEDLRLASTDGTDNDADGSIDEVDEYWTSLPSVDGNGVLAMPFTVDFVTNSSGELNSSDLNLKLAITQDTLGTEYPLASRKTLIGGCWGNYSETQFQSYLTAHQ